MGVPVIALKGDSHVSRVSASILEHAGLNKLIGGSKRQYINRAAQLAKDPDRMRQYRNSLRDMLTSSELMNGPGFAAKIEDFYRRAYSRKCEELYTASTETE